jgi:hypothetical protein
MRAGSQAASDTDQKLVDFTAGLTASAGGTGP